MNEQERVRANFKREYEGKIVLIKGGFDSRDRDRRNGAERMNNLDKWLKCDNCPIAANCDRIHCKRKL